MTLTAVRLEETQGATFNKPISMEEGDLTYTHTIHTELRNNNNTVNIAQEKLTHVHTELRNNNNSEIQTVNITQQKLLQT